MDKHNSKRKQSWFRLKLLNPKNLEKEVHVYGYNFSWKTHVLVTFCSVLGISAIGILFQLKPSYFSFTIASVIFILPVIILSTYRRMYEQKRFADAVTYMEQMLYSFQKNGKIASALRETREIFDDGQMGEAIDQASEYLNVGMAAAQYGGLREALGYIQTQYDCAKMHTVHEALISSEEYGGDSEDAIILLLTDLELWKRRGYRLQAQKKTSHTDNILSIIIATILCAVALYVLESMNTLFPGVAGATSIFQNEIIQISSFLFILFMLFVFVKSQKTLTDDWLKTETLHDENFLIDSYNTVMQYDESAEKKKSIIYAAPFLIGAIVAFFYYKMWLGVGLLLIGAFMLMQHRVGYNLARRDINQELYVAMPQWLMNMALLLQNNNVQVSIAKSIEHAPMILQEELRLLMERLAIAPSSLKSYTDFCSEFDIPEAQTCMKMLHAISESGTGNAKVQINNLVQRVHEMQSMADEISNKDIVFKAKLIFSYPVFAATIKLLMDLTLGMMLMMQMLSGIGGM